MDEDIMNEIVMFFGRDGKVRWHNDIDEDTRLAASRCIAGELTSIQVGYKVEEDVYKVHRSRDVDGNINYNSICLFCLDDDVDNTIRILEKSIVNLKKSRVNDYEGLALARATKKVRSNTRNLDD